MKRAGTAVIVVIAVILAVLLIVTRGGVAPFDPVEVDDEPAAADHPAEGEEDAGADDPDDVSADESEAGGDAPRTEVNDAGPVGANGPAMLRADVPRLVIEVVAQDGVRPDAAAPHRGSAKPS